MVSIKKMELLEVTAVRGSNDYKITFTVGKATHTITSPINKGSVYDVLRQWNKSHKYIGKPPISLNDDKGLERITSDDLSPVIKKLQSFEHTHNCDSKGLWQYIREITN